MSDSMKSRGSAGVAANVRVDVMKSDTYDGRELKPFDGRPGAMDAFHLPSRNGPTLTYPREVKPCKD